MKKLLLSVTLLAAVPGLQAQHCSPCSASKTAVKKSSAKCSTCATKKAHKTSNKKNCHCNEHSKKCSCKGGPIKRTLKATGNVVEDTRKVIVAPFEALFGDEDKAENKDRS